MDDNRRHDSRWPDLLVAIWSTLSLSLTAIALILLLARSCCGAPAPLPRHQRTPGQSPLPRHCVMEWCGVRYDAEFLPGGGYRCDCGGRQRWVGTWRLDGRTLTIRERWVGYSRDPAEWVTWVIRLDGGMRRGRIEGSGSFVLLP